MFPPNIFCPKDKRRSYTVFLLFIDFSSTLLFPWPLISNYVCEFIRYIYYNRLNFEIEERKENEMKQNCRMKQG